MRYCEPIEIAGTSVCEPLQHPVVVDAEGAHATCLGDSGQPSNLDRQMQQRYPSAHWQISGPR